MLNINNIKEKQLSLENYKSLAKLFVAIRYIPNALRLIEERMVFPPFTFHISGNNGHAIGLSSGQICYPVSDSENYEVLKLMIIRLEDKRFYSHSGMDVFGIIRALYSNISQKRIAQGGSTLTQQLVRNILLSPDRSFVRKVTEAILARKLESIYSKTEILRAYCSFVYLGHGVRGFEAASRTIYRKTLNQLNQFELAGLVGLLRAPNKYHPLQKNDLFIARQAQIANRLNIKSEHSPINPISVISLRSPRFGSIISHQLIKSGISSNEISSVKTTIDLTMQRLVDQKLKKLSLSEDLSGLAVMVLDNASGEVLVESSWQKGINSDFSPGYFGKLQPGSTFKTFTLIAAIEQGIPLELEISSAPFISSIFKNSNKSPWTVRNYAHSYRDKISLIDALKHSDNTVFARLTELIDQTKQYDVFYRFGLNKNRQATPAITLGSIAEGLPLIDLINAYRAIACNGVISKPVFYKHLIMRDGSTITPPSESTNIVISEFVAKEIHRALQVSGQITKVRGFAGKTGTTKQGQIFCGYDENVSVGIWLGYNKPQSEYLQKGITAISIFHQLSDALLGQHNGRLLEII
jgi:penicillin-binding protein 1A